MNSLSPKTVHWLLMLCFSSGSRKLPFSHVDWFWNFFFEQNSPNRPLKATKNWKHLCFQHKSGNKMGAIRMPSQLFDSVSTWLTSIDPGPSPIVAEHIIIYLRVFIHWWTQTLFILLFCPSDRCQMWGFRPIHLARSAAFFRFFVARCVKIVSDVAKVGKRKRKHSG